MSVNWSFPRVYVPSPVWRVRTSFSVPRPKAQPRRVANADALEKARARPDGLDRDAARALVDAGYMPLQRYIELFGDDNTAGEGEV